MSHSFVTNLGDLFVGHDKRKYPYVVIRESKNSINGKHAYEYITKAATRLLAETKAKEVEEDPCFTVRVIDLGV